MNVVLPKSREMNVCSKGPIHSLAESGHLLSVLNEHKVRKGGLLNFWNFPTTTKFRARGSSLKIPCTARAENLLDYPSAEPDTPCGCRRHL